MAENSYLMAKSKLTKMDLDEDFNIKCKLIEEMERYPLIYDKAHPYHFNRLKKEATFQEITYFTERW